MAKCVIVSGTRICSGSPYRVNNGPKKPFPTLSAARAKQRRAARKAIQALALNEKQEKLANDLMDVVFAVSWDADKAANAKDIVESVQLLLVNQVPRLRGKFTLIAY